MKLLPISSLFAALATTAHAVDDPHKILFFGDSWTARAQGAALNTLCQGEESVDNLVFVNHGASGSIAANWSLALPPTDNLEAILQDNADANAVWINMGGNDLIETGCQGDLATIMDNYVQDVVNRTAAALPQARILLTTYGRVPLCPDEGFRSLLESEECKTKLYGEHPILLQALADQLEQVSFVDILYKFDSNASIDEPSSWDLWADCIHINDAGYNLMFEDDTIQSVLCPMVEETSSAPIYAGRLLWLLPLSFFLPSWKW